MIISMYSNMCMLCDVVCCYVGVLFGSGGGMWVVCYSMCMMVSVNIVMLIYLCYEKYFSLVGVKLGMFVII